MKVKTARKTNKQAPQQTKTLDTQHSAYLANAHKVSVDIEQLKKQVIDLDVKVSNLRENTKDKTKSSAIDEDANINYIMTLVDEKLDLQLQIKRLEKQNDLTSYYTKTANVLYQYYDLVEKGDVVDTTVSKHSILDYFRKAAPRSDIENHDTGEKTSCRNHSTDKGWLLEKYMSSTIDEFIKQKNDERSDICNHCKSVDIVMMSSDGYSYCNECSSMEFVVMDHDKPSYKDPPKEISYFAYKRINHLNECINQSMGKESTTISDDVFDRILIELSKQKITNMADLTYTIVKRILKSLELSKYYEHVQYIITALNGLAIKQLSPEIEDRIRSMFKQIQTPFLKHSPGTRRNFLSYSFVLHKLIQLLEQDDFLKSFPLLRSREKLHQQDLVWKLICKDLGWQFYPSC